MNSELKAFFKKELKVSSENVLSAEGKLGFYSTGFPYIDRVVSDEGMFPIGGLVEIFGPKSSCKTTLVLHAIGEEIRKGTEPIVWWSDFEGQLTNMSLYAKALGVDIESENFIHRTPTTLEEGGQEMIKAILSGGINFLVVDSTASMRPRVEVENKLGETKQAGVRGKLVSELLRNLVANVNTIVSKGKRPPAIIFINQMYEMLNLKNPAMQGKMFDSPASNALKFYASARVELKAKGFEKRMQLNPFSFLEEEVKVASLIEATTEKNKVGIPFKKASFAVRFGEGVDPIMSFIKAAITLGVIAPIGNSARLAFKNSAGEELNLNGFFQVYDYFRDHHDECLSFAQRERALDIWVPVLRSRLPMVEFARSIMNDKTAFLEKEAPASSGEDL